MTRLRVFSLCLGLILSALSPVHVRAEIREGALEEARRTALEEGKYLYLAFLGEGWSLSCKRFRERVLQNPVFQEFARDQLVYFPVLARRKPPLSREETAVLQSWVIHLDIKTYPTLILIAPDGRELLRHHYRDIDGPAYTELLRQLLPATAN